MWMNLLILGAEGSFECESSTFALLYGSSTFVRAVEVKLPLQKAEAELPHSKDFVLRKFKIFYPYHFVKKQKNKNKIFKKYYNKEENMYKRHFIFCMMIVLIIFSGCSKLSPGKKIELNENENISAQKANLTPERAKELKVKKLFEFTPKDLNDYLKFIQYLIPDLSGRVVHLARKSLGQEYKIFLLGEFPFEIYDTDPLFCLQKSDCLVFTEHIYSMALAKDWPQFFALLQRIRYINGEISTTTRNHSTIPQWVGNNNWLIKDISEEIAPGLTRPLKMTFDPNPDLISGWGLNPEFPKEEVSTSYIPAENIPKIVDKLQNGDYVNVIRGFTEEGLWCGHVGLITKNEDGTVNFLHSISPNVVEQPILEVLKNSVSANEKRRQHNEWVDKVKQNPELQKPKRKFIFFKQSPPDLTKWSYFWGFKFYRLQPDPLKNLIAIDGQDAPIVTGPKGLLVNRKDKPAKQK